MPGGAEVLENPAGGGAGAWPRFQTLPAQHHLSLHGAGLPRGGRGQSLADMPCRVPPIQSPCAHRVSLAHRQRSSPDVKAEMFELLYQILHQNWRYFFKTSVLTSVQRGLPEDNMENEAQFTAAMQVRTCTIASFFYRRRRRSPHCLSFSFQAFGQSFLQPDIHIFKQNLSYLESLNSKHKLYHRVSRVSTFRGQSGSRRKLWL